MHSRAAVQRRTCPCQTLHSLRLTYHLPVMSSFPRPIRGTGYTSCRLICTLLATRPSNATWRNTSGSKNAPIALSHATGCCVLGSLGMNVWSKCVACMTMCTFLYSCLFDTRHKIAVGLSGCVFWSEIKISTDALFSMGCLLCISTYCFYTHSTDVLNSTVGNPFPKAPTSVLEMELSAPGGALFPSRHLHRVHDRWWQK